MESLEHLVGCEVEVIDSAHCRFGQIGKVVSLSFSDSNIAMVGFDKVATGNYDPCYEFTHNQIKLVKTSDPDDQITGGDYFIGCWVQITDLGQPNFTRIGQIIRMIPWKEGPYLVKVWSTDLESFVEQWISKASLCRIPAPIKHVVDVGDRVVFHCPVSVYNGKRGQVRGIDATEPEKATCDVALDEGGTITVFCKSVTREEKSMGQEEQSLGAVKMSNNRAPADCVVMFSPVLPDFIQCQPGVPKLDSLVEEAHGLYEQLDKLRSRLALLRVEQTNAVVAFEDGKKTYEELRGEIQRLDNLHNTKKKIEDALTGSITRGARNVVDLMLRGGRGSWKSFEELECVCGVNRVEEVVAAATELESSLKVVEHGGQKLLKVKRFF